MNKESVRSKAKSIRNERVIKAYDRLHSLSNSCYRCRTPCKRNRPMCKPCQDLENLMLRCK